MAKSQPLSGTSPAVSGRGEGQPKRHTKVLYKVVVLARDAAAAKGSRSCQAVANALVPIYHSTNFKPLASLALSSVARENIALN